MDRRKFLELSAAGTIGATIASSLTSVACADPKTLKKAVKLDMVRIDGSVRDKFELVKEIGFQGVEIDSPSDLDRDEVVEARDATGVDIHGVIDSVHWQITLSDPDPAVRARGVEALRGALEDAKLYGASTVLLVPAVVKKDVSYADAYTRSQAEIWKVIPQAEDLQVSIAIEYVWNGFLLSPLEFARYVDEFESEWVGAYFDPGNTVNTSWPEHWIEILGPRILKFDMKEFSRTKRDQAGPRAGFDVPLGQGEVDWPTVMEAFKKIGYTGWATAEVAGGGRERLTEVYDWMDEILY